mmetsp:Transcript_28021/g.50185  ORF Transcript_28021/g.50185 Transcript_28021/m.50185 type:complete len:305 (+) Transcript_28021:3151-4065(+)
MHNMDDSAFDWEQNVHNLPFLRHMIAGSIAGVAEHCLMFPIDTIKTQMQAHHTRSFTFTDASVALYRAAGITRLWTGISSVIVGCVPAHAAYFSIYEISKKHFGIEQNSEVYFASTMTTGCLATLAHDFIMTPMDVIKQRMQLSGTDGVVRTASTLIKKEGAISLFRSLPVTYAMNVPFAGFFVTFNENLKSVFLDPDNYSVASYFACAALSGSLAAVLTTPFDVVKTRMQTQTEVSSICKQTNKACSTPVYCTIRGTIKRVLAEEGLKGFTTGALPRMLYYLPGAAVSWTTYEQIKRYLEAKY